MKVINKELVLLSKEDIEKVVSESIARDVDISEIDCTLTYFLPCSEDGLPSGMGLMFVVDKEEVDAFDVFFNETKYIYEYQGTKLSLSEPYLEPEYIFDFDIEEFRSFSIECDGSD